MTRLWGYCIGAAGGVLVGGLIGLLFGLVVFLPPWDRDPHRKDGEALLFATQMAVQAGAAEL
jgi:hypothetical protein